MLDTIANHSGNQSKCLNAINVAPLDQMLDFGIKVNNAQFLADLEKSPLWKKVAEVCLDSKTHSKPPTSIERTLLYYVCDWAGAQPSDPSGRPSFFSKLLKQVLDKAPPHLKAELESPGEAAAPKGPAQGLPSDPQHPAPIRVVVAANKSQQPADYYSSLFRVAPSDARTSEKSKAT